MSRRFKYRRANVSTMACDDDGVVRGVERAFRERFSFARERKDAKRVGLFSKMMANAVHLGDLGDDENRAVIKSLSSEFGNLSAVETIYADKLAGNRFHFFVGSVPLSSIIDKANIEDEIPREIELALDGDSSIDDIVARMEVVYGMERTILKDGFDPSNPVLIEARKDRSYFKLVGGNHRIQAARNLVKAGLLSMDVAVPVAFFYHDRTKGTCKLLP